MSKGFLSSRKLSLFLISFTLIGFELALMRVFSSGSWSNFGSMVISIALLGYGLAGVLLTFLQERVKANAGAWMAMSAAALPAVMGLCYSLAQLVPFNPIFLVSQGKQIAFIACYYVLFAAPFFVGAIYTAAAFMQGEEKASSLYFFNMAGSGSGGLALILFTYFLPVGSLVWPFVGLGCLAALLAIQPSKGPLGAPAAGHKASSWRGPALVALSALVAFGSLGLFGGMYVSPYKASEQAKMMFPDLEVIHRERGPLGEYEVLKSSRLHFAPGLSDNAVFSIDEMPKDAFWGLYIDNDGPIGIMRQLGPDEERYIDFLPMSAAYKVLKNPRVLLVKLGGGFSAYAALHHKAQSVTIVEPNPVIVKMVRDVKQVRSFTGDLLSNSQVKVVEDEPRAFCARPSSGSFDLVELSLIDSVGLSQSAGYSISENYSYTVEAVQDYLKRLSDDGVLSISVWNHLSPPRNVPKLLATVVEALKRSGYSDPLDHVYAFDLMYSTATVLVKKSGFTTADVGALDRFCHLMSFKAFAKPGMADPGKDFPAILQGYVDKFKIKDGQSQSGQVLDMDDLYHYTVDWAGHGKQGRLYKDYLFDIRPSTDDRPYYSVYMKPKTALMFADKLSYVSEDWSYYLSWVTLFQAIVFGVIIALLPLLGGKRRLSGLAPKRLWGVIAYFACLGLGYMLVELYLMQKLVFFLAQPIFASSIVITTMLILSGIGSLLSERLGLSRPARVRLAALGICVVLVLYIFALPPLLKALLGIPLWLKVIVTVAIVAPAALLMGVPFPSALGALSQKGEKLLPWAYGVNGALSVSGSLISQLVSMHSGYTYVLLVAIAVYAIAGLLYPINEAGQGAEALSA